MYRNTFLHFIALLSKVSKFFSFSVITRPKWLYFMSKVPQILKHFCWWLTSGTFRCSLRKIYKRLHRYDQIAEWRRLWSLRQMLYPGNDSWVTVLFWNQLKNTNHSKLTQMWPCLISLSMERAATWLTDNITHGRDRRLHFWIINT